MVIQSYDSEYKTDKLVILLLNSKIKEDYDVIISEIDAKKKELMSHLSELSGIDSDIDKQMSVDITFKKDGKAFIETLKTLELTIENANPILANINYAKIFNEKTLDVKKGILNDSDFHNKINKYFNKYNELIEGTRFFRKSVFNHQNAEGVLNSLKKNGFLELIIEYF